MNWDNFIILYTVLGVGIFLVSYKLYKGKIRNLLRIIVFINVILFLFDYIAYDLDIWRFPVLWGVYFFHNPIENILFVTITLTNLLTSYLYMRNHS